MYDSEDEEYNFDREDYNSKSGHNFSTCELGLAALPSILSSAGPLEELAASLRSGKSSYWIELDFARTEYLKVRRTHTYSTFSINIALNRGMTDGSVKSVSRPTLLIEQQLSQVKGNLWSR